MKKMSRGARSGFARLFSSVLILFLLLLASAPNTFAEGRFSTNYNVIYSVASDQNTKVVISIELKNNTSDYYASNYSVQTGFGNLNSIKVSSSGEDLKYTTQKNSNGMQVSFPFNKNVVGINKSQNFSISYTTPEIAKKYGSIWEINIPGITDQTSYSSFNAEVKVPSDFGNAQIIKPQAKNLKQIGNSLLFTKSDLGEGGISIAYGSNQIYNFNLKYHLYNKNLFPVDTEIAIPSNNNYQEIKIEDISPKPTNAYIDSDGNWLAKYRLSSSSKINVTVKGSAKVSYKPREEVLTDTMRKEYLASQQYWEVNDPRIQKLAKELKTPQAIFNYVVNNLKYDSSRVKEVQLRAGAVNILANKNSAVCLEFTDLFITLARSAGIPAREVQGFANTDNSAQRPLSLAKDVLHAWPEYYDENKKTWVMVDPTWENTTGGIDYFNVLDFDHFAFVINGLSSTYPVPAGGYKLPGQENTKDVEVTPSNTFDNQAPGIIASTDFSKKYLAGLPVEGKIIINNLSGVLVPSQTFSATSSTLTPYTQNLYFDDIPPFGQIIIPIKFNPRPILTNETDSVKITVGRSTIERSVVVSPFYKDIRFYFILGGLIFGSIAITLSLTAIKSRRLHVSG